ncbi:hypothetical protein DXG03_006663 [Asterophora parasitica]|uniref:RlpA-like protein double-psi beta-barrel domain-containing protein n=1 Tax=Asterophora parasitica TaxID=117018 RepID=A0A9P7G8M0_9AGAR|nr:hypothetical protein DXG03_006663 [Asterophora parasitica]
MFTLASLALVLTAVSSVSGLVVPRATAPPGWATARLEPYAVYHTRYLALGCQNKHNSAFFHQCCRPLLASQKLETARPKQCIPPKPASTSAAPVKPTSVVPVKPTPTPVPDDDDEYDDCDDEDYNTSTTPAVTAPTPSATSTKAAPAPTQPAAQPSPSKVLPAPQADPSPNASVNTGGFATFFYQNGVAGACGTVHGDNDMIAAIDGQRYGNLNVKSGLCGKKVQITNPANKKSVTVTIADACPTCKNGNSIDLSEGAFKKIATLEQGMVGITWSFV